MYHCDTISDFIWPFLQPNMGVIPNPKMAFIFPISCILALIFPNLLKYFPKCEGKGSFLKSQIKTLHNIKLIIICVNMLADSNRALDHLNLGSKFGPIFSAKKYVFSPISDEKFPIWPSLLSKKPQMCHLKISIKTVKKYIKVCWLLSFYSLNNIRLPFWAIFCSRTLCPPCLLTVGRTWFSTLL